MIFFTIFDTTLPVVRYSHFKLITNHHGNPSFQQDDSPDSSSQLVSGRADGLQLLFALEEGLRPTSLCSSSALGDVKPQS